MYKVTIFNHSGQPIQSLSITSQYNKKQLTDVADSQMILLNLFAPFNKKVQLTVKQPEHISSITFTLEGLMPIKRMNQLEIMPDGTIKHGELGLK